MSAASSPSSPAAEGSFGGGSSGSASQPSSTSSGNSSSSAKVTQPPIKINALSIAGVDVTNQAIGPLSSATITSGRTFTASETNAKVVVVDSGYAKQNSLAVGGTVTLGGVKYKILGISKSASAEANVYIPLQRAQTLADAKGKVNQIYVKATSSTQIAQVKKEIKAAVSGVTVTTAQDLANQVSGSLSSASKLANQLGKWLAIAALIAAIAVASLLTLSTVSRRVREFGTLKAIGWKSRRIVSQVLGEALVQGLAGGAIGVALGYAGTRLIGAFSPSLQATVGTASLPTSRTGSFFGGPSRRRRRRTRRCAARALAHRDGVPPRPYQCGPAGRSHRPGSSRRTHRRRARRLARRPPQPRRRFAASRLRP